MKPITLLVSTLLLAALAPQPASADPVTFRAEHYGCELRVDGKPQGRVETDVPRILDLPRGREYLIECESHDIPVKLYSRNYLFTRGDFQRGPLPNDMKMKPIAVLPNVIRAAAAKQIQVTTVVDSYSLDCRTEKDPKNPALTVSSQVALNTPRRIPKGISVQVTGSPQMHCGDTNLIEVIVDGSKGWFRNRDFAFSYKQKAITLFEVSQDLECCWIE